MAFVLEVTHPRAIDSRDDERHEGLTAERAAELFESEVPSYPYELVLEDLLEEGRVEDVCEETERTVAVYELVGAVV